MTTFSNYINGNRVSVYDTGIQATEPVQAPFKPRKPTHVKISAFDYNITYTDINLFDKMGHTDNSKQQIVIGNEYPEQMQRAILLHEILHAIGYISNPVYASDFKGENYDDTEHYFIGMYEVHLIDVLENNPEVTDYLRGY